MAAAHDLPVVPHGSSVYSYHLQFAFNNCPVAEYINLSPKVWACGVGVECASVGVCCASVGVECTSVRVE